MFAVRSLRSLIRLSANLQQLHASLAVSFSFFISFVYFKRFFQAPSSFLHTTSFYRFPQSESKSKSQSTSADSEPNDESSDPKSGKAEEDDQPESSIVKFGHMFDQIPNENRNKENFQKAIGKFFSSSVAFLCNLLNFFAFRIVSSKKRSSARSSRIHLRCFETHERIRCFERFGHVQTTFGNLSQRKDDCRKYPSGKIRFHFDDVLSKR